MIKVCVSGNNGFIGRALYNKIQELGHIPLGLEKWIFDRVRWQDRLHEYLVNLSPDVIFHVGACSDTQNHDVNEMMKLNVESTMIIADYCQFKKIPIIYSSSAACYGTKGTPNTLYAWSKYLGEQYVTKCRGISLRYFNVYGMNESHKGKMASIAYQSFLKHNNGEKVFLFPNKPTRDFVYINDVVSANIHAWQNYEQLQGGMYEVGSGESRPFEDVLDIMKIPYTHLDESNIPENYQEFTCSDPKRYLKGWNPEWNLEKGIDNYLALLKVSQLNV
jgi:ADP-L-glycero-D-manno-heptose 6-epimerase